MSEQHPLRYWIELGGHAFPAREVRGREGVSSPFRFEVRFHAPEGEAPDPDEVCKKPASIVLRREQNLRAVDGIVTEVGVGAAIRGAPEVVVVVEPRFTLSRFRSDVRLFRDRTVPEIVTEVLAAIGVAPELRLRGGYPRRPYCVQHRETDFDFVSRLLEDEGIAYFFLEDDVMVLADDPAAWEPIQGLGAVPFRPGAGASGNDDSIHSIGRRAAFTPGKVTLRDWNPDHPSLNMDVSAAAATASGPELYDFPGEYLVPAEGQRKAALWAASFDPASDHVAGTTFCARFAAGHAFTLLDGPPTVGDGDHVITEVTHDFKVEAGGFSIGFEALDAKVPLRPERRTQAPRQPNPVTGFVTGSEGQDIHTDERGRVKVHFHWDRVFPRDDSCSDWIPVLQDNTGHSVAIPRVGWEVLVHFLEGDPDRPVVLGRVYNAEDTFPATLPESKTQTALKSMSSPTRDGTNEIRMDDLAGAERMYVHAEKDQNVNVANDKRQSVLADEVSRIGRDETIAIGQNHTAAIGHDFLSAVSGNQTESVGANRDRSVSGSESSVVQGDRKLTIGGMHFRRIGTDDAVTAKQLKEQVGAVILEASLKQNTTQASKAMTLTVGGALIEVAKADKTETAGLARIETIGGVLFSKAGDEMKATIAKARTTTVGAALTVDAKEKLILEGKEKWSGKATMATLTGDTTLTLKVGDTTVTLADGTIVIDATTKIALKASAKSELGASESDQN
jgi:type VI secretion system secreted protein VgrG